MNNIPVIVDVNVKNKKINVIIDVHITKKKGRIMNIKKIGCKIWRGTQVVTATVLAVIIGTGALLVAAGNSILEKFKMGFNYFPVRSVLEDIKLIPSEAKELWKEAMEGC